MFDIRKFIENHVICRSRSMFETDFNAARPILDREISGKRVLVIGGAGTIGASFIKALLPFHPAQLAVVDICENGLTELTRDLRSSAGMYIPNDYRSYPFNFADPVFERFFRSENGFDIVANFSAHKHVRSEKDRFSVAALLENNVLEARCLLELLVEFPPRHFFCVSTDKAANPVNIMGASKRIMEDLVMSYSDCFKVSTARFANVAFSNGSLPAGFLERLNKRQPLSAPRDVKRYFVSPEESGQICLMACILGGNRETFFPKLGEEQMMTFSAIADQLLNALGLSPRRCDSEEDARNYAAAMPPDSREYPVYYFISDTTGEKGFEEFFVDNEQVNLNRFRSLGVIENRQLPDVAELRVLLTELDDLLAQPGDKAAIIACLKRYLPNFNHMETGRNLDQKM